MSRISLMVSMRIILIRRIASAYWRILVFSVRLLRGIKGEGETPSRGGHGMEAAKSDFADELGLQFHGTDAVDFAVDVVVAFAQADVLDLGANLDHQGRTLDLEVLDHGDGVTVLQDVADRILFHHLVTGRLGIAAGRPLVGAFRADQLSAILIGVLGIAFWAGWQSAHFGSSNKQTGG